MKKNKKIQEKSVIDIGMKDMEEKVYESLQQEIDKARIELENTKRRIDGIHRKINRERHI